MTPMASFTKVAKTADIPKGCGKAVEVAGKTLAVFNCEGIFYAIENACRHRGGPLAEGMLAGKAVTCPWHGWEYDITTGRCSMDSSIANQRFDVKVEGDDILIAV